MARTVSVPVQNHVSVPWWTTLRHIFIAPEAAFRDLPKRFPWLVAYLSVGLGLLAYNLLTLNQTRALTESMLAQGAMPESVKTWIIGGFWVGVWVTPFIMPLVSAFGYTAILGFLAPLFEIRDSKFERLFTLSLWAMVPAYTVGNILRGTAAQLMDRDSAALTLNFSLQALFPADAPKLLTIIGQTLDVFALWTLTLIAVGFASAHKRSLKIGFIIAGILLAGRFAWLGLSSRQGF